LMILLFYYYFVLHLSYLFRLCYLFCSLCDSYIYLIYFFFFFFFFQAEDGIRDYKVTGVQFFFSSRRRHTRLQGDWSSDVCSSDLQVDQLPVVRLAQQLLYLSRLDRRFVPLDLRHRLAELLRAHRAGLPAQPTDGLLDEAERAVQGKRAAAPFPGGREGGRLVRRDRLCARLTLVTPPPTPPP